MPLEPDPMDDRCRCGHHELRHMDQEGYCMAKKETGFGPVPCGCMRFNPL
jgi:hypothetical protein